MTMWSTVMRNIAWEKKENDIEGNLSSAGGDNGDTAESVSERAKDDAMDRREEEAGDRAWLWFASPVVVKGIGGCPL